MKKSWMGALLAMTMTLLCGCEFGDFCGGGDSSHAEASIYVSDASTGKPVAQPLFTEAGVADSASCGDPEETDPSLCDYMLLLLAPAPHTIVVSAPGYQPQTISLDTSVTLDAHLAVELRPQAPVRVAEAL